MFQCWFSLDPLGSYIYSQATVGNQGKVFSYWPALKHGQPRIPQGAGSATSGEDDRAGWFPEENVGGCWKSKGGWIPGKQKQQRSHFPVFQRRLYCLQEHEAISRISCFWLFFPVSVCRAWLNPWLNLSIFLPPSLLSTFSNVSASWLRWSHIQRGISDCLSLALIFVTHVCLWFLMLVLNYPPVRFTFTSNSPCYAPSISTVPWNPTGLPQIPSRWRYQGSTIPSYHLSIPDS